jgi:hypothetical protein
MWTPDDALAQMQANAALGGGAGAAIGALLGANNTGYADGAAARAAYLAFLYPFDTPANANSMGASQSTCGIAVRSGWRAAGVAWSDLLLPYADCVNAGRYAVMSEKNFATANGAWSDATNYSPSVGVPGVGDACVIGCSSCQGTWSAGGGFGGEHEFLVGAIDPTGSPTGPVYGSIDGGQPGIRQRSRVLVQAGNELWFSVVDPAGNAPLQSNGRPVAGRRIIGWSRLAAIPFQPGSPGALGPTSPSSFTTTLDAIPGPVVAMGAVGVAAFGYAAWRWWEGRRR